MTAMIEEEKGAPAGAGACAIDFVYALLRAVACSGAHVIICLEI